MQWTYAARIDNVHQCTEATSLLKVARHSQCLHGWRLIPNKDSPYEQTKLTETTGQHSCTCPGLTPPDNLKVNTGPQTEYSISELFNVWPKCGRCGHALADHGKLLMDPEKERVRRSKVAIRLDELLEVSCGLWFTYQG
jgi:hypothetical protein